MELTLEAAETPTLDALQSPLPAMEHPRQGYLIFDGVQRIVHASSSLHAVLRLSNENRIVGESVSDLLALAVGNEPDILSAVASWFHRSKDRSSAGAVPPLVLLTSIASRTVNAVLDAIDDQYWIASFDDVTDRVEGNLESLGAVYQDRLTGIGNRLLFEHRLDETLSRVAREELQSATVLLLDLDRFKVVNDTLGHAVGDALLCLVCGRLQSSVHASDTLARLGGDEFAILLAHSPGPEVASDLAKQIIDLIQRPYLIDGHVVTVGASIGIAVAPIDGRSRDQLLKSADLALYHSKSAGRGIFHFFQPAMEVRAQQRRTLEMDLRKAVVLRQFELHYQPQINVETQTIIGLEGLLRWRHPQRGLLLPGEFLELAEEIGLAVPIGEWVLKTACKEATRWPEEVTIAVNISPLQFEMEKFASSVERVLAAAALPGHRLEIEVTEDILLRDGVTVMATLTALRVLGVRVAMDSFGTGLASMSQLVNFPFDKIKIDRSLVDMDHDSGKHRAIIRAISALGESLGISTLAEGVETAEQLAQVRSQGCHSVQGFFYSQAVPASELAGLFQSASRCSKPTRSNRGDV